MPKRITVKILIAAFVLAMLSACPDPSAIAGNGLLSLRFTQGEEFKTILPAIDMAIAYYDVNITRTGKTTVSYLDHPAAEDEIVNILLEAGIWTVEVKAKNAAKTIIGTGQAAANIIANPVANVTVTVMVSQLPGNGSLKLAASWPAEMKLSAPAIAGKLTPAGGGTMDIPLSFLTIAADAVAANLQRDDIPAGSYTLSLDLKDGPDIVATMVTAVHVVKGQLSSGDIEFTIDPKFWGKADVTIVSGIPTDFSIVFDKANATEVLSADGLVITATTTPAAVGYSWYLNGEPITIAMTTDGEIGGNILNLKAGILEPGWTHRITLLCSDSYSISSKDLIIVAKL